MKNKLPGEIAEFEKDENPHYINYLFTLKINGILDYLAELTERVDALEKNNRVIMSHLYDKNSDITYPSIQEAEKRTKEFADACTKAGCKTSPSPEPLRDEFDDMWDTDIKFEFRSGDGSNIMSFKIFVDEQIYLSVHTAKRVKAYLEHLIEQDKKK